MVSLVRHLVRFPFTRLLLLVLTLPNRNERPSKHQGGRERLQACVDSMKPLVPKEAWERLRVDPEDGLIVFGEKGMPSKVG